MASGQAYEFGRRLCAKDTTVEDLCLAFDTDRFGESPAISSCGPDAELLALIDEYDVIMNALDDDATEAIEAATPPPSCDGVSP